LNECGEDHDEFLRKKCMLKFGRLYSQHDLGWKDETSTLDPTAAARIRFCAGLFNNVARRSERQIMDWIS
jgi:hypothetical protein